MSSHRSLLSVLFCAAGSNAIRFTVKQSSFALLRSSFSDYKNRYGRTYASNSEEHHMREEIFQRRLAEFEAHNAMGLSWKKGVSHLTDWTDEELDILNGHKPSLRSTSVGSDSFLQLDGDDSSCSSLNNSCTESSCCSGFTCGTGGLCVPTKTAVSFDWSTELSTAHEIVEQGRCGSCWAVAATAALNLHAEIVSEKRFKKVLSPQSILACSSNKLECGGRGGCRGATAEVAYDWVKSMGAIGGVLTLDQQPYTATDDMCSSTKSSPNPAVSVKGWKKIRENDAAVMMNALVTVGPLVTSIAARGLHSYSSGVIGSCPDNVVNHAVVLMGFGNDQEFAMNYWNVRNSWGKTWGEDGFFRLKRAATGVKEPCGWDKKPEKGVVCKDKEHGKYPTQQWVCGECGFLIDTAYPIGTQVPQELVDAAEKQVEADEEDDADEGEDEAVQDNAWCKMQCQHFGMKLLSEKFDGVDFGSDPEFCAEKCDEQIPAASA